MLMRIIKEEATPSIFTSYYSTPLSCENVLDVCEAVGCGGIGIPMASSHAPGDVYLPVCATGPGAPVPQPAPGASDVHGRDVPAHGAIPARTPVIARAFQASAPAVGWDTAPTCAPVGTGPWSSTSRSPAP